MYIDDDDGRMRKGVALDLKTNRWVETESFKDHALESCLSDESPSIGWIIGIALLILGVLSFVGGCSNTRVRIDDNYPQFGNPYQTVILMKKVN